MSDELDQTIEELEAEVLAELEEAEDPQKKGAAPAQAVDHIDEPTPGQGKKAMDLGGAKPDAKVEKGGDEDRSEKAIGKKAAAAAKDNKGDPQQKGEQSAEPMKTLAASYEFADEAGDVHMFEEDAEGTYQIEEDEDGTLTVVEAAEGDEEYTRYSYTGMIEQSLSLEDRIKDINVEEDVMALVGEDDDLSEEFKIKAATIFEAAVKSRVRSEIERIQEEIYSETSQEVDVYKDELTEKVDTYLNYVVEEWTKENELAIERGLKGEIAEDFISGLKQLFEDHYIDVPDEKYNVLEAQSEKISELEDKLNEAIQKSVDLTSFNSTLVREQVISEVSEDLADTEIEKFKSLTQDVDFGDEDSFREKLDTLKENYFPKQQVYVSEETFNDEDGSTAQDVDTTDAMRAYMSAISRNQKASA
jgi:hypothetical protein